MARWHRKKARRAVSHRRTPTGEPCSVRGGNGRFDYNRNRAFERRARSAPTGAAHSSADSCSSAMGSIPAGRGVCGRGRARKEKVRTWGAEARRGPEHMTRAGACPRNCGRRGARPAPKHNAPRRGGCFARAVWRPRPTQGPGTKGPRRAPMAAALARPPLAATAAGTTTRSPTG